MKDHTRHELPQGILLHERYRVEKLIGAGGFGITYLCRDERLQRQVCIKEFFLSGHCTRGPGQTVFTQGLNAGDFAHFRARFSEEARALARFRHPGIVQVLDVFEANNTAYYSMDYVEGETLKALVLRKGRLTVTEALPLMHKLLDAVETVHAADLLHRDIKPDNIIVRADGQALLIDFGNARHFRQGRTLSQTAILTPGYAPPEQYTERARRGPYTDVYGLGATLYFALTGMKPLAVTDRQMEQLKAPHQLFTDIPETLSSAVMLAMNINPEDRFQDAPSFKIALLNGQQSRVVKKTSYLKKLISILPENLKTRKMKLSLILILVLLLGFVVYKSWNAAKPFPHPLAANEQVIRSFYNCYDHAFSRRSREDCVQQYFSESYGRSKVALGIIHQPYAFKKHSIKEIRFKEEDKQSRVLTIKYDFSFKVKYNDLTKQRSNGTMEITLNRKNRIEKIQYVEVPEKTMIGSGQAVYD